MSSTADSLRILRAQLLNRVVVGYAVPPSAVISHLPEGLAPIRRDGAAYVSLVGGELARIRVLGLTGPGLRRVSAVELRVHVRRTQGPSKEKGTWTVQAHVPRRLLAWGARLLYHEPVAVAAMRSGRRALVETVEVTYRLDWKGREQRLRVRGEKPPVMPVPDALARLLLEPSWRFRTARDGSLLQARVERPAAPVYRVQEHHVTVQWPDVYGDIGRLLEDRAPALVAFSPSAPVALQWREQVSC